MERKMVPALACLLIVVLTSFALIVPTSAPNGGPKNSRYIIMEGSVTTCTQTGIFPKVWSTVTFTPMLMGQNITFSDPHPVTGVINLTVPAASYVGVEHTWYDETSNFWYTLTTSMATDGYGWLFTGTGTSPILGDVDYYIFNNNTGVYWDAPGDPYGLNGTLAALPSQLPDPGPDGVAGTGDDGFGDGTPDPIGSSILYLPTTINVSFHTGTDWTLLFSAPWPQIFTTGTAYDIVIETASLINGANSTEVGEPWEFLAGVQHPPAVDYGHAKWNAYVTYVCAWSVLDIPSELGDIDVFYEVTEKKVREDVVIADINSDEIVDIFDIVICAAAFGAKDEKFPDRTEADPNWDPRADLMSERGVIDIFDLVRIAGDFGAKLTKDCIIRP